MTRHVATLHAPVRCAELEEGVFWFRWTPGPGTADGYVLSFQDANGQHVEQWLVRTANLPKWVSSDLYTRYKEAISDPPPSPSEFLQDEGEAPADFKVIELTLVPQGIASLPTPSSPGAASYELEKSSAPGTVVAYLYREKDGTTYTDTYAYVAGYTPPANNETLHFKQVAVKAPAAWKSDVQAACAGGTWEKDSTSPTSA